MSVVRLKLRLRRILAEAGRDGHARRTWVDTCRLEVERWSVVAELIRRRPFASPPYLPRSAQWRRAVALLREAAPCPALLDWLLLQVEVAANVERGVRDLRPRRDGPCHALALAFAEQRLRKAVAVLAWAETAAQTDADMLQAPSPVFAGAGAPSTQAPTLAPDVERICNDDDECADRHRDGKRLPVEGPADDGARRQPEKVERRDDDGVGERECP